MLLCEEMGIDTGVDLDALIEVGRMAEEIVGHQLPSELIHAGSLDAFRPARPPDARRRRSPGIKVLEFSHTVMGPTAGLVFAELGADVVKVEPAPKGDHTRGLGGFGAGFFAAFNRNKRSLAVDLKRPEGQAVIHRLVADRRRRARELRPRHDGAARLRL